MPKSWYVIRVQPRAEYVASYYMHQAGYEIFFPYAKSATPRFGRTDEPMFPGYLFINCASETDGWPTFRASHRVAGWVRFDGIAPQVPESVITQLAQQMISLNGNEGLWRSYAPGEKVWVASGPIEGLAEVVEGAKSPDGRAKVLMDFIGGIIPLQIPWMNLRPVEDAPPLQSRRTRGRGRWIKGNRPNIIAGAL